MITLAGLSLLLSATAAQVRYPERPGDREFIVDGANLLNEEDAAEIRKLCDQVLTTKKVPILVVTLTSLQEWGAGHWNIERYALNLFSEWEIGWGEWNRGMLLLVSRGDRKARIELGADWGRGENADARRVMNELLIPNFKRGDYSKGLYEAVKGLHAVALDLPVPRGMLHHRRPRGTGSFMWIIILVVGVGIVGSMFRGGYGYGHGGGCSPLGMGCMGAMLGNMLFGGFRHWGGGYGGGGSWSGGSFGGGFSGGGGASGSW